MPQPTKEQFDAAARKVMETAKPGLSREEFFALIDHQLTPSVENPSALDMASGKVGRDTGGEREPDTWAGGFIRGLRREFVDPLLKSPMAQGAAHPQTKGDVASLLLPSGLGMGSASEFIPAAKKLYQGAAKGAAEKEGLKKVPAVLKGMWGATKRNPDQMIANYERDLYSKGHVAPSTESVPDSGIPQGEMPTATPGVELETPQDVMARGTGPTSTGAHTDRIPYGSAEPSVPTQGKTLEQVLQGASEKHLGESQAPRPQSTTLPDQVSVGGFQKPKVGKRPGGYTTDNPPKPAYGPGEAAVAPEGVHRSPADVRGGKGATLADASSGTDSLETLMDALHGDAPINVNPEGHGTMGGGSFQDTMRSTEPEFNRDLHTGAAKGSPEANSARVHHQAFGEMDADFKRRMADPLSAILMSMLTGGGALASRQTAPNTSG